MKHKRTLIVAFVMIFLLSLGACASMSNESQPSGSFSEDDVPYPRMFYYVLGRENGGLYYIPLSEDEAELCRSVFTEPEIGRVKPEDYVGLFHLELDSEQKFTVYESLSGGYFFSYVESPGFRADEAVEILLDRIGKVSGQDADMTLPDFKSASRVALIKGGEVLWSTVESVVTASVDSLLDAYIGSGASNFENYDYELKFSFADGSERTLLLSSDDGFIFVPPLRYYKLPKLSPLRFNGWLNIFEWEAWPE